MDVMAFDDLNEKAKDTARDWLRSCFDTDEYICVVEDFQSICAILGIDVLDRWPGRNTASEPAIWWSGFASQGDGASFEAEYCYAKGSCAKIRAYAPMDKTLHAIADSLADVQRRNFYGLSATVSQSGRYYHEYTMFVDLRRADDVEVTEQAEQELLGELRNLARWLYRELEAHNDYIHTNEAVDGVIRLNEYGFLEDGSRTDLPAPSKDESGLAR